MNDQRVDVAVHVRATLRWLQEDPRLHALLELTHGRARAGQEALCLVLPLILGAEAAPWGLLHEVRGLLPTLAKSTSVGLASQSPWTADAIDQSLDAISTANGVKRETLERVLEVLVLRRTTPLPIAGVLAAMGQGECATRLEDSLRMYLSLQLVS